MLYFANPTGAASVQGAIADGELCMIRTPGQGNALPDGVVWCADNGRFGKGWPGFADWYTWLERNAHAADRCMFAVAPDVVGDAAATLDLAEWLQVIRELGYPAAYVAQDGQESLPVPWDDLDVLFIGGSTDWKLGAHARALVVEAKARGKWVHLGRVNSRKRMLYASAIGADSCDGTLLTFGPDKHLPPLLAWLRESRQPTLPVG